MTKATFELYQDKNEAWRWRLRHDNGEIIANGGEAFASKQKAQQGVDSVKTNAGEASVEIAE